jgi:hypothetical protein
VSAKLKIQKFGQNQGHKVQIKTQVKRKEESCFA